MSNSAQTNIIRLFRNHIMQSNLEIENENNTTNNPYVNIIANLRETSEEISRQRAISNSEPMNEEDFLTTIQSFMPHRDLNSIRDFINRVGNNTRTFQEDLIQHFNSIREHSLLEEPITNRYYVDDDIAESFDELILDEESKSNNNKTIIKGKTNELTLSVLNNDYVDFRLYPCNIDWEEVNNPKSKAYDVLEKYGYLGCYVYLNLLQSGFKVKYYKLETDLLSLMTKTLSETSSNNEKMQKLAICLPTLEQMKAILGKHLIREKELVLFKIILDSQEVFLKFKQMKCSSVMDLKNEIDFFHSTSLLFIQILQTSVLASSKEFKTSFESLIEIIRSKTAFVNNYLDIKRKLKINFLMNIGSYKKRILNAKEETDLKYCNLSIENFLV